MLRSAIKRLGTRNNVLLIVCAVKGPKAPFALSVFVSNQLLPLDLPRRLVRRHQFPPLVLLPNQPLVLLRLKLPLLDLLNLQLIKIISPNLLHLLRSILNRLRLRSLRVISRLVRVTSMGLRPLFV
jgi:hypothetical protein